MEYLAPLVVVMLLLAGVIAFFVLRAVGGPREDAGGDRRARKGPGAHEAARPESERLADRE